MNAETTIDEPQTGTRIDDFTVAYRLARGMSADVFAVWHHTLRAPLICKRLRPDDALNAHYGAKWRKLLRDEGAALARLTHPGIVRLIGQNQQAALPYLLLEHVGSKTLRDRVRERGRLPLAEAVGIVQHVGAAVAYAHARGYLHRDLKPSNIILRGGRPVLLDFGVVWRWRARRRPPDRSGTPQYLAPEQIARHPLTPRTDVYGLGTLLFELLTGQRPFPASERLHDLSAATHERYPQLTATPPLTASRAGRRLPRALNQIIARCLLPESEARYPDVPTLLLALDPFTTDKIWPSFALDATRALGPVDDGDRATRRAPSE